MRALVVEDEPSIAADVAAALTDAGFVADIASDGEDALFRGDTENYAVVILDLGLPTLDGLSILKRWRADQRNVPVLVLTARAKWVERVEGIYAGADDYLTKPFEMEELVARVRALIRRSTGHAAAVIQAGRLHLDTRHMRVAIDGCPLVLTPLEYRLVAYLLHNKGRVVSAGELIEHVYDHDAKSDNALEALIMRLRRKLGSDTIETRRGFGYCIPDAAP